MEYAKAILAQLFITDAYIYKANGEYTFRTLNIGLGAGMFPSFLKTLPDNVNVSTIYESNFFKLF